MHWTNLESLDRVVTSFLYFLPSNWLVQSFNSSAHYAKSCTWNARFNELPGPGRLIGPDLGLTTETRQRCLASFDTRLPAQDDLWLEVVRPDTDGKHLSELPRRHDAAYTTLRTHHEARGP